MCFVSSGYVFRVFFVSVCVHLHCLLKCVGIFLREVYRVCYMFVFVVF